MDVRCANRGYIGRNMDVRCANRCYIGRKMDVRCANRCYMVPGVGHYLFRIENLQLDVSKRCCKTRITNYARLL